RRQDYKTWVEHFARNHRVPLEWPPPKVRNEDLVASRQRRCPQAGQFGVYYIIKSKEQGWTFRVFQPKFPSADPNYQIVRKQRSLYRRSHRTVGGLNYPAKLRDFFTSFCTVESKPSDSHPRGEPLPCVSPSD